MKIQIEYFPLLRDLKSVDSGTTDASAARAMDVLDRYKNIIPVPTPLGELEYHMYYLVRSVPPINWDSIKNMRVGIVRGTATVLREAQKHDIIITLVPSHKLGFEMLERKRIDILIANSLVGDIHAAKLKDWIKVDSRLLYKANVYHMVNKGHHDLVPRLDSIIKDMQQEGLIKKIVQKYRPGADITFPDQNPNRESASSLSGNN